MATIQPVGHRAGKQDQELGETVVWVGYRGGWQSRTAPAAGGTIYNMVASGGLVAKGGIAGNGGGLVG